MTIKEQFQRIKENWLIMLLLAVVLILFMGLPVTETLQQGVFQADGVYGNDYAESAVAKMKVGIPSPIYDSGFAPETEDRKITKTASLNIGVKQGTFQDAESKLKSIVKTADAFLLNENVQKYSNYGDDRQYYSGNYNIKVEEGKYDALISQLKEIDEMTLFGENAEDITKQFVDLESELAAEKERLLRYQQMLKEATTVEDKIMLSDRIFDQERIITFLEKQLKTSGEQASYSTVYVVITEKQSEYANAVLVKFSELITTFVTNMNSLLKLLFGLIPYAVAAVLAWLGWKRIRRSRPQEKKK